MSDSNFIHSTLRERIVEHVFVGEALRLLWKRGVTDVEVLRSEFDAHGYDLVLERGPIVRHVQFKTGSRFKKAKNGNLKENKPSAVSVACSLARKPGGCVIWIAVTPDLDLGPFHWFGGEPGKPLPDISKFKKPKRIGRTAEGERPLRENHRLIPPAHFVRLASLEDVLAGLFGPLPEEGDPVG